MKTFNTRENNIVSTEKVRDSFKKKREKKSIIDSIVHVRFPPLYYDGAP